MANSFSNNHVYWKLFAGLSGFIAIAMGAVGAHATADGIAASLIEKASYYQLIHSVMLIILANYGGRSFTLCRYCFAAGIILFSGSLYVKALSPIAHAPLAPLGGSLLMLGWLSCTFASWANRAKI